MKNVCAYMDRESVAKFIRIFLNALPQIRLALAPEGS